MNSERSSEVLRKIRLFRQSWRAQKLGVLGIAFTAEPGK
jgi:hypothetical protein